MTRRGALMVGLLLALQPAMARAEGGGSLDWLIGKWAGTGTSFGKPSEARFEAAPALDGKFVELRYAIPSRSFLKAAPFIGRRRPGGTRAGSTAAEWFSQSVRRFPVKC